MALVRIRFSYFHLYPVFHHYMFPCNHNFTTITLPKKNPNNSAARVAMSPGPDNTCEHKKTTQEEENELIRRVGWKALLSFTTRKHIPILCLAFFCATVAALTLPAFAVVYGLVFRQFASFGSGQMTGPELLRNASKYCTYLTALAAINWFANSIYFASYLTFGELQASSARNRVYKALLQKDIAWYDMRKSGITAFLPSVQS
jgi:ATP-binding cassette subfamily B (MDR/TAP) protein 1